jgi:hypothetical protein
MARWYNFEGEMQRILVKYGARAGKIGHDDSVIYLRSKICGFIVFIDFA